ncbi:hypothetical protein EB796_013305 [Bugula neritina]|uniref:Uncharacterized protein n=1 Tax=Bugula neritina TaxID=10212 RepID=A0A7J7JSI2_BUGNE|nr:hypothetical protein EB796_013305 [Bugula neritina]
MQKIALTFLAIVGVASAFSRNAISLGLVSDVYPIEFWDALANTTDSDLEPGFRRFVLLLDRTRAGDEHWCCHHGRTDHAKVPVYNNRGEVVAWNQVPCEKVGCCDKFLEVANHCLDKEGQSQLLDALDIARTRLGAKDTADLISLLKSGNENILG